MSTKHVYRSWNAAESGSYESGDSGDAPCQYSFHVQSGVCNAFEVYNEFTVVRAKLELEVVETELHVLEKYTRTCVWKRSWSLAAAKSKKEADESGLAMDEGRRDRAIKELEYCVIKAKKPGLVIYPSSAAWKDTPDVTVGAGVRRDQTLLLMPDLTKMQVKVGIHESLICVHVGMAADINYELDGKVSSVASLSPAGWWTGNVVKYDVIVDVPSNADLKPGMTAEVDLPLASYPNQSPFQYPWSCKRRKGVFVG